MDFGPDSVEVVLLSFPVSDFPAKRVTLDFEFKVSQFLPCYFVNQPSN